MAMLAALCALFKREKIFCLHVDHGLRNEESREDAEFVRSFCEKTGIACRIETIPSGKIAAFARRRGTGIEAAARIFRLKVLFREAARLGENTYILTAHTKDDMLETILMRVLRGAGPAGLAAMPVKKNFFLRPLLSVTRADIIRYLTEKNIPWREDSTNTDENFLRNRIRRRLVPLLNDFFPSWETGLSAAAATQSLTANFIAEETTRRIKWSIRNEELGIRNEKLEKTPLSSTPNSSLLIPHSPFPTPHSPLPIPNSSLLTPNSSHSSVPSVSSVVNSSSLLITDAENFFAQMQIIREEALFYGIDILLSGVKNPRPVKRSVVRRFCEGVVTAADLGPAQVWREGGNIALSLKRKVFSESGFSLLIKEPGLYNLKMISVKVDTFTAREDDGFFAFLPLVLRRSFAGDFIVKNGRKITRRRLKKRRLKRHLKENLISALDKYGTAAFIGTRGFLAVRDVPVKENELDGLYLIKVKMINRKEVN